jgi:antitoxin ParD1/3/4
MSTMNISLPEPLKNFVDERVANAGYGTSSEYLRELIRRDQDRLQLRSLIVEGAKGQVTGEADTQYFSNLRNQANIRLAQ